MVGTGRVSVLQVYVLSAQVRYPNVCTSCKPTHMDVSVTHTGRTGLVCVEDGRERRPRAFVVWM